MKIGTKVTISLIIVFTIGILISGISLANILEKKAESEIDSKAAALMTMNNSIRTYTNDRVQPLLLPKLETQEEFIPEAIPTYAVREAFEYFRKSPDFQNFLYKDAALNPTNLRDKADDFEAEIVNRFRQEPETKSISGFRNMNGTQLYYTAKPFQIKNESCLRCHTTLDKAPQSQINTYGTENGYGWKLNEIVATQIVYVPAQRIFDNANRSFMIVMGVVAMIFTSIVVIMNLLLKTTILQRIKGIATVAEQVSVGDMDASFGRQKNDEIGDLAEAFNRMKYSLEIAMNMLNKDDNR
jgi:HAMP domain-containing protein